MNQMPQTREEDQARPRSWLYNLAFGVAMLVAAIAGVFFFIGLTDGSVSSFNITLWLGLLGGVGAVLFAGHRLRAMGHTGWAIVVLGLLALPGLLYALFVILVVFSGARWN